MYSILWSEHLCFWNCKNRKCNTTKEPSCSGGSWITAATGDYYLSLTGTDFSKEKSLTIDDSICKRYIQKKKYIRKNLLWIEYKKWTSVAALVDSLSWNTKHSISSTRQFCCIKLFYGYVLKLTFLKWLNSHCFYLDVKCESC